MSNLLNKIEIVVKNHGHEQFVSFQKKLDECLADISNLMNRRDAYYYFLKLSDDGLSDENSDYICDIVSDIRGHTARIYHKFSDDPQYLDDEQLLTYVRKGTWN